MIITIALISVSIVAAIYGTLVTIILLDMRKDKKKPKTTRQTENYWKYPIGQP